jgi:hypothetical protein
MNFLLKITRSFPALAGIFSAFLLISPLHASFVISDLEVDDNDSVSWQGVEGHVYFLQWSTDLVNWYYVPSIYAGTGTYTWQYTGSSALLYCRIRGAYVPSSNPYTDDFDDDGLSNYDELVWLVNGQSANLDPLNADTDGDGIGDGIEAFYGTDPSVQDHAKSWDGTTAIVLTPTS